jgi:RNA polymerase sigma-70 factor, ECF subfamily
MDIAKLIQEARQGNSAAFGEIYDLFADRIFRYIRLKVQDPSQAEDILQEVFVKSWQGLPTLRLEGLNFNAWIYKIAGNTVNDHFRKLYRSPQTFELDENINMASPDKADREIISQQDRQAITQALAALPVQYRQVLELRFIQEFSISETADVLGKSNLAVRLLQHRALVQLRKIFNKDAYRHQEIQ